MWKASAGSVGNYSMEQVNHGCCWSKERNFFLSSFFFFLNTATGHLTFLEKMSWSRRKQLPGNCVVEGENEREKARGREGERETFENNRHALSLQSYSNLRVIRRLLLPQRPPPLCAPGLPRLLQPHRNDHWRQ